MAKYAFATVKKDYQDKWSVMTIRPDKIAAARFQARTIIKNKARYKSVQDTTGVPWFVIGCLHMRESGGDFNTWLHNGEPMKDKQGRPRKTTLIPANRPPNPNVTWEQGAYDALVVVEELNLITDWEPENVAYAMEKFNGFGYRAPSRNIPSPYLWGGTSIQKPGKFVRDGEYDKNTMDTQLGGMAVLKCLLELDNSISFDENIWRDGKSLATTPVTLPPAVSSSAPPETSVSKDELAEKQMSPAARDTEASQTVRPAYRSKQVIGVVMGYVTTVGSTVSGFFSYLNNPYTLAAFVIILIVASFGAWLVLSGRIELVKMVDHLVEDDGHDEHKEEGA